MKSKPLLDSMINGVRVSTFELYFPRFLLAQFNTHRVMSRNASSSRALPLSTLIRDYTNFTPPQWRKHAKGMQPKGFIDDPDRAESIWEEARKSAIESAKALHALGVAKETCNRLLEPFSYVKVLVTATDFDNFFALRSHPDAQFEIKQLSDAMKELYESSTPEKRKYHLPYVDTHPSMTIDDNYGQWLLEKIKQSVARCARVSYATHDGKEPKLEADLKLYDRLVGSEPIHASPAEHQVMSPDFYQSISEQMGWPMLPTMKEMLYSEFDDIDNLVSPSQLHGNFKPGVIQYRKILEVMK